ncbi:MAG: hypothetical protein HC854_18215, partial [Flavobacterium sp.]|nr:hypothetical protein [Flavobacterium sp.]
IKQNATFFEIDAISFAEIDLVKEYKLNNGNWIKLTEPILDFKNYKNGNYNLQFRARLLNSNWTYSKNTLFQSYLLGMNKLGVLCYLFFYLV